MKKLTVAALLGLSLPLATCTLKAPRASFAREWAVLNIWTDPADKSCKMQQRSPTPIFTSPNGKAAWVIAGDCGKEHTVAIDRQFRMKGGGVRDVMESGDVEEPATDGGRLQMRLKRDTPEGTYEYQILIDGKPAEYASPADRGLFVVCPDWPCRAR
jgi:hypothetical protein